MQTLDTLSPTDLAHHLADGFRQSAALAVLFARQNWRRIDATVLALFRQQAATAAFRIRMENPFADPEGSDEQLMLQLLEEIAMSRGTPLVGPNLRNMAAAILQQHVDATFAIPLVVNEGPASMARIRALLHQALQMGVALPPLAIGIAAAMAVPLDALPAPTPKPVPVPPPAEMGADDSVMLNALGARLELDIREGRVAEDRAPALRRILTDLGTITAMPRGTLAEMTTRQAALRSAVHTLMELMSTKHSGGPEYRSTRIRDLFVETRVALLASSFEPFTGSTVRDQVNDLLVNTATLENELTAFGADDARTIGLEETRVRDAALQAKRIALREHAMLVDPLWGHASVRRRANAVFVSAGSAVSAIASAACSKRRLHTLDRVEQGEPARTRFDQLRECHIGVFDLTVSRGPELARVCYELGIALVLGRPAVIVTTEGTEAPFDIDLVTVSIHEVPTDENRRRFGLALDRALIGLQRPATRGFGRTVDEVVRRAAKIRTPDARSLVEELEKTREDPPKALSIIESLLGLEQTRPPLMVHTTFEPRYATGEPRLFHVMPFSPPWANEVRDRSRVACGANVRYRRGDDVGDARIVSAIWEELCLATHVLVDLTGFNANVSVELGIAHALGKPTLLVGQVGTTKDLFPSLRKVRIAEYALEDERLEAAVRAFVSG